MNTLLVIDMQNAWLNAGVARFDRDGVIERINLAARHVRAQGGNVIFIQHCDADAVAGTPAWELDAALEVCANDRALDKTACDSFSDTALLVALKETQTRTVLISGLATEFCVDTTLRAAASLGFDVVALSDAHTTGDREHLSAERIVEHHNWVWANLATPKGCKLVVCTVQQMLRQTQA